jgi:hypothetical protein
MSKTLRGATGIVFAPSESATFERTLTLSFIVALHTHLLEEILVQVLLAFQISLELPGLLRNLNEMLATQLIPVFVVDQRNSHSRGDYIPDLPAVELHLLGVFVDPDHQVCGALDEALARQLLEERAEYRDLLVNSELLVFDCDVCSGD